MDLVPLMAPALAIICVAVIITVRERNCRDVVLDLTDVPDVRLAEGNQPRRRPAAPVAPFVSDLVPEQGLSLGARLQLVAVAEKERTPEVPPVQRPKAPVVLRRRRRPLVAASHRADSPGHEVLGAGVMADQR